MPQKPAAVGPNLKSGTFKSTELFKDVVLWLVIVSSDLDFKLSHHMK